MPALGWIGTVVSALSQIILMMGTIHTPQLVGMPLIYNSTGDAWVEEFYSIKDAMKWLERA